LGYGQEIVCCLALKKAALKENSADQWRARIGRHQQEFTILPFLRELISTFLICNAKMHGQARWRHYAIAGAGNQGLI
jgi:hypothetical protein